MQSNVHGDSLRYQVREGGEWKERSRPIPRGALLRLQNSLINLRLGAALLAMWQDQHPAIDEAFPESVPHRSAVAHFGWGDVVLRHRRRGSRAQSPAGGSSIATSTRR